ncbi:unnamed protein product [Prorocentrum cordatum]|uniref:Uncharacterized protein n=1 Tax=Prorocentrum cordatum TaxID=2364126 RepID=A0ABN9RR67_9DINO|nr:unnamed protein product [Polarella glacialis]
MRFRFENQKTTLPVDQRREGSWPLPATFVDASDSADAVTCIMWDGESVCGLDVGRDPGRRTQTAAQPGAVLALGAGFAAAWRPVRAGDALPEGAVRVGKEMLPLGACVLHELASEGRCAPFPLPPTAGR